MIVVLCLETGVKGLLVGAGAALLATSAGLWVWQSRAGTEIPIPPPPPELPVELSLPVAGADAPKYGLAPPEPPAAPQASREEQRFNRYDRNRDELVSRVEMMSSRTRDFRKLDKDGNNLLTFEEWAAATGDRFATADANRDKLLTRKEFLVTRPKRSPKPTCRC
jgi:hypothetical protein